MQAKAARDAGITLIPVGVGPSVRYSELRAIASWPQDGVIIQAPSFQELGAKVQDITDLLCNGKQTLALLDWRILFTRQSKLRSRKITSVFNH